jgi:hypothetical protein
MAATAATIAFADVANAGGEVGNGFEKSGAPLDPFAAGFVPKGDTPSSVSSSDEQYAEPAPVAPFRTRYEASRYRPRRSHGSPYRSSSPYSSPAQIQLGFFDPEGDGGSSFVLGARGGPLVDPHIQIGGGVDWHHKSDKTRTVSGDPYQQGGTTVFPERVLSRASADLLPFYLFMQVGGDDSAPVVPYGGASIGYQVLFLSADDYQTGENYEATFGGFMWEGWAGAAIPLSGQSRAFGEVFVHQGDAEREVDDIFGTTYRERVTLDGVGARFGLSWGF